MNRSMLTVRGTNGSNRSFDWKSNTVDAVIMAALTFFAALGGLGATGVISQREVVAAAIAAATQFFLMLAIKRGLREK